MLKGKRALVTGAARRIGREICLALARRGADLLVHYHRSGREAASLVRELGRLGIRAEAYRADLSDVRQTLRLADAAWPVDILVHNASLYEKSPLARVTAGQFDRHMAVNLRAPLLLGQKLGQRMRRAGGGKIIHIADWSVPRPYADTLPYSLSKAGLLCLSACLAKALAPEVQVNAVLPGAVLVPPRLRRAAAAATLSGRLGSPSDVADAVAYLAEASSFVTGTSVTVDGGRSLR